MSLKVTDEKISMVLQLNKMSSNKKAIAQAVSLSRRTVDRIINAKYLDIEKTRNMESKFFNWKDFNNSII